MKSTELVWTCVALASAWCGCTDHPQTMEEALNDHPGMMPEAGAADAASGRGTSTTADASDMDPGDMDAGDAATDRGGETRPSNPDAAVEVRCPDGIHQGAVELREVA